MVKEDNLNAEAVAADIVEVRSELGEYELDCIFTVCEMVQFLKSFPLQTYVCMHEARMSARETKKHEDEGLFDGLCIL